MIIYKRKNNGFGQIEMVFSVFILSLICAAVIPKTTDLSKSFEVTTRNSIKTDTPSTIRCTEG